MSIVDTGDNGPLCPMSGFPFMAPEHRTHVDALNRAYSAAPKDSDGDMTPESEVVYRALERGGRMLLYVQRDSGHTPDFGFVDVQAAYYVCGICGCLISASITS